MRKIKIGIDVGGTFTHAVAVNVEDFSVEGKACVPTTHNSDKGVAEGVVSSMLNLIENAEIQPEEVILIAHSTTQATNALLEGDVEPVGIIALGRGIEGRLARRQSFLNDVMLAPGKMLPVHFKYINTTETVTRQQIKEAVSEMHSQGASVFVATEAFGPDNNDHERMVVEVVEEMGFMGTAACDLSQLYGIRVRTRTAIVNASMMPKMMETANLTEKAVRESGIDAQLMVMRSDGGIMDINEMRKRPILTMLSGPAAGVAAGLMYARISDGIFIEVGGTSTDICVIKNGMPQLKTAQIGNNRLSVKTIDVRTIGVAGGSIPRINNNKLLDVGPRSAHIANLAYAAYTGHTDFSDIEIQLMQPKKGDPADYLKITKSDGDYTISPTEASYYLGLVKETGHGAANMEAVNNAVEAVAGHIGMPPKTLAEEILRNTSQKVENIIKSLVREYKLDRDFVVLYGGGGGASSLVPHAARYMNMKHKIARDAEVISAIGAAMGMIRDTVEKSIINPTENDIIKIRQEASESVISMGARPETVEVHVEVDNANKKVIAVAMGSSDLQSRDYSTELKDHELHNIASEALKAKNGKTETFGKTKLLSLLGYRKTINHFFGLMSETRQPAVIISRDGTIKRKFDDIQFETSTVTLVKNHISSLVEELRTYGDGGELMPDVFVMVSGKIIDLSGLISLSQILSLVELDLKDIDPEEQAIVIAIKKR